MIRHLSKYSVILCETCVKTELINNLAEVLTSLYNGMKCRVTALQHGTPILYATPGLFGSFGNEPMESCSVHRVVVLSVSASVYSPPSDSFNHRNFLSCKYMQLYSLIYAHEVLGQCDLYFLNDSHFSKFLYVALLATWLNLEPSYLAQLCTYTGATCKGEIMPLSIIFLKL